MSSGLIGLGGSPSDLAVSWTVYLFSQTFLVSGIVGSNLISKGDFVFTFR